VHRLLGLNLVALLLLVAVMGPAGAQEGEEPAPAQEHSSLTGLVTDADGDPVGEAVVVAVAVGDVDTPVAEATTDEDGTWELELAEGEYHLHITDDEGLHADQWWDDRGEPVDVVTVPDDDEVDVELGPAARITGTVHGPDGPVSGARVSVTRTTFSVVSARSDADGAFELGGLRGGTHDVLVDAGEGLTTGSAEVSVGAGEVAETLYHLRRKPDGVERVAGADRVATAVEASRRGFTIAPTAVLADARSFPDALAAAPLAASVGGPLLLVGPRVTPVVLEELARLGTQEVIVVGAIGAVPLVVSEELGRAGLDVRRIAGDSRFDTAALIAREVGGERGHAIVASGLSFADALSVAPYAAAHRIPILLTGPDAVHPDTVDALEELEVTQTVVVGGTAVVSDAALASLPSPRRVSGEDRYATSRAVAELWAEEGASFEVLHVATGRDYPDALAAGPVAGLSRGPLLLVDGLDADVAGETYELLAGRADDIDGIYAFGGAAVLTDAVLERLHAAIAGRP
jgi:putative cell wall-binding protein